MGRVHYLKTWPEFFKNVESGRKRFEVRVDDREFHEGDCVILQEWFNGGGYTGRQIEADIGYILKGAILAGYVVFALENVKPVITVERAA